MVEARSAGAKAILAALLVTHWAFILLMSTYVLWAPRRYDVYYLTGLALLVLSWLVVGGCALSVAERSVLYPDYTSNPEKYRHINPSFSCYTGNQALAALVALVMSIAYAVSLFIVLRRWGRLPMPAVYGITAAFVAYMGYYRYREIARILRERSQ